MGTVVSITSGSPSRKALEALNSLKLPTVTTKKAEVLTKHITEESKKDPKVVAQILRTWMSETPG